MARPRKPYDQLQFQRPNSRHRGRDKQIVLQTRNVETEVWACVICGYDESPVYGWEDEGVALCAECIRELATLAGICANEPVQNESS